MMPKLATHVALSALLIGLQGCGDQSEPLEPGEPEGFIDEENNDEPPPAQREVFHLSATDHLVTARARMQTACRMSKR